MSISENIHDYEKSTITTSGCVTIELSTSARKRRAKALAKYLARFGYWSMFQNSGLVRTVPSASFEEHIQKWETVAFHGSVGLNLFETSLMRVVEADYRKYPNFTHIFHTTQKSLIDGMYSFGAQFSKKKNEKENDKKCDKCFLHCKNWQNKTTAVQNAKYVTYHCHKLARPNDDVVYPIRHFLMDPESLRISNTNSTAKFTARCRAYVTQGSQVFAYYELQSDGSHVLKCHCSSESEGLEYLHRNFGSEKRGTLVVDENLVFSSECMDTLENQY